MRNVFCKHTLLALVVSAVAGVPLAAQAAGGHTHATPHGGVVVQVAQHHIEFKADSSGLIAVWVLDEAMKLTAAPSDASVTLMPEGGAQIVLPLKPAASGGGLTARFEPTKLPAFHAVVSLLIGGKRHNVRFNYPAPH